MAPAPLPVLIMVIAGFAPSPASVFTRDPLNETERWVEA